MNKLLLVDADPRTLNVLGVSFRQGGYDVAIASDGAEALAKIEASPPRLLVTATRLQKLDGYDLVGKVRDRPATAGLPVIFLASEDTAEDRRRALELGVEEFLKKPVFVREVVARAQLLLSRQAQQEIEETPKLGRTRIAGSTLDVAVVDLVQSFEASGRSGVVHLRNGNDDAHLYLRDGRVIDAEVGPLHGEDAVYESFRWVDARFEIELKPVMKKDLIGCTTQTLLRRGMQRVGEALHQTTAAPDPPVSSPAASARAAVPAESTQAVVRSSSAPVTREIAGVDAEAALDAAAAGLPSESRWTRRIVAVAVLGAAALVFVGGLRSTSFWKAGANHENQAPPTDPANAGVAPAKATESLLAAPTSHAAEAAPRGEANSAAGPAEGTTSSGDTGEVQPSAADGPRAAGLPPTPAVGREAPLDVKLAAANLSPLVRDAQRALLKGDTERALSLARQAVAENSADAEAWLSLGAAQRAAGDIAAAATTYRSCVGQAQTAGLQHCRILAKRTSGASGEVALPAPDAP